jgi:hypothetical protein
MGSSAVGLGEWVLEHKLDQGLRRKAFDLGKRIREYRVPAYVVETDDDAVVRDIYERANNTGKQLKREDVFKALYVSRQQDRPASLEHIAQALASQSFGAVDPTVVLDTLAALENIELRRKDIDYTRLLPREQAPRAFKQTEAAMLAAAALFRGDVGMPHARLVPYSLAVVVVAKFFHHFPEPSTRSRILLRRWIWRGALAFLHTSTTESLRAHLAAIAPGAEDESLQRLLRVSSPQSANPDAFNMAAFRFDTARGALQTCALAALRPVELVSGEPVRLAAVLDRDDGERIPRIVPPRRTDSALRSGLAARMLHLPQPTGPLADALSQVEDPRILASHGVSLSALHSLRQGDYEGFFRERQRTLSRWLEDFFARQAEWGADDSPPLASLAIEE